MGNNEISASTMLGVGLVALAVLIGLFASLLGVAQGVAGDGRAQFTEQIKNIDFEILKADYDDRILLGSQVIDAIDKHSEVGSGGMIIYVATRNAHINGWEASIDDRLLQCYKDSDMTEQYLGNNIYNNYYCNFGVLMDIDNGVSMYIDNNSYIINGNIDIDDRGVSLIKQYKGIDRNDYGYINPNSKYYSSLLWNIYGDCVGIVFEEIE